MVIVSETGKSINTLNGVTEEHSADLESDEYITYINNTDCY